MDYLWSPWRYAYVSGAAHRDVCIFCEMASDVAHDRERLVLHRGKFNLIVLNRFPYTSGHVMIAPYQHVAALADLDLETLSEIMALAQMLETVLRGAYRPDGYNIGMNLGRAAGAGIADHLHLHVLPRWSGDVNFMTAVAETRVLPEDLNTSYEKLVAFFRQAGEIP
jgi:ATP adenylyltransferase